MKIIKQLITTGLRLSSLKTNVYGIEIELEDWHGTPRGMSTLLKKHWNTLSDDSLREGVEFVSPPISQLQLKEGLDVIDQVIRKANLKTSKRCSIHVHVNAKNMTWGQTWSLLGLYTFLEPDIFKRFAPERDENHFCVPMYWNTQFINRLARDINILRELNVSTIKTEPKRVSKKKTIPGVYAANDLAIAEVAMSTTYTSTVQSLPIYSALNGPGGKSRTGLRKYLTSVGVSSLKYSSVSLYRLPDLGTVEFRILPGTTDMALIQSWVQFLGRLKHVAMKYPDPIGVQRLYEDLGHSRLWRMLQMGSLTNASAQDRQEAEEAACKLVGQEPVKVKDLDWKL